MSEPAPGRTGGQILVDQLKIHGVDTVFCVPGESYIAVLDGLYGARDAIRLITCRQEGSAVFMAEAYGKLTGRPGVCFVTRGPGATNASIGVHTAYQDSTPLVLFIGQVARSHLEREAFQEIDYRAMFGSTAKWVSQVDDPRRVPELVSRAFHLAVSGRPGPVVLALPEDMLAEICDVADARPYQRIQASPSGEQIARLRALLDAARQPLVIVGGGDWTPQASEDIQEFVAAANLPCGTAFRRQDLLDNRLPQYAGDVGVAINPALARRVQEADLLLVIGDRLSETVTSDYTLLDVPSPRQTLVHVHPDPHELGRVYQADLPILSGMPEFAAAARAMTPVRRGWDGWTEAARADYLAFLRPPPAPGALDLGAVIAYMRERLPGDAIVTNGAGNYTVWLHRFYQWSRPGTQLAPASGAMGYGLPAAVAAKAHHPERIVVALAGDGCFLMNGQELATAVAYGLNVAVLVVNNGMYGTIRMHQERSYPGRTIGTDLSNPDFAAYARSFGAHGEVVERTADFAPAFERALTAGRPALLELRVDPEAITPRTTLSAIRAAGRGS